jgi:hypothetical protein
MDVELWFRIVFEKEVDLIVAVPGPRQYLDVEISYSHWEGFSPYCGFEEKTTAQTQKEFLDTGFQKIP